MIKSQNEITVYIWSFFGSTWDKDRLTVWLPSRLQNGKKNSTNLWAKIGSISSVRQFVEDLRLFWSVRHLPARDAWFSMMGLLRQAVAAAGTFKKKSISFLSDELEPQFINCPPRSIQSSLFWKWLVLVVVSPSVQILFDSKWTLTLIVLSGDHSDHKVQCVAMDPKAGDNY